MDDPGTPFWRRHEIFLVLIALALVIRVAFVFAVDVTLRDDPADYHRLATLVADGDGFGESQLAAGGGPTAFRAPLLPASVGVVYAVAGNSLRAGRLFLALFGTATVALIAAIAHLLFGRRVALIATLIAAVYPPLVLISGNLLTEAVFLPFELGVLLAALHYRRRPERLWLALTAGALVGLAALSRQVGIFFVVPIAGLLFVRDKEHLRRSLMAPVVGAFVAGAVVLPWTIRNYVELDTFIPVSNDDGFVYSGVFNESARKGPVSGVWRPPVFVPEHAALFRDRSLEESELARILRDRGLDYAKEHPAYDVKVVVKSTLGLFDLNGLDLTKAAGKSLGYGPGLSVFQAVSFWVVALLAIGGAFTRAARRVPLWFWATPVVFTVATVIVLGHWRYRAPLEPFFVLLAALAINSVLSRVDREEPALSAAPERRAVHGGALTGAFEVVPVRLGQRVDVCVLRLPTELGSGLVDREVTGGTG